MTEWAVCADGLSKDFGRVRAVDGLSLQVPAGALFGFLGPNGSGKTTTIRLLLGLLQPTGGRAQVLGLDVCQQADVIRSRAGALLEHAGLYERLTAEDNLEFYGRVWHLPAVERRTRIQELLTHVGLWERRKEAVGLWSRGQRQKLAVVRALLHRPSVVFLDEPTAGLDPVAALELGEDLAGLAAREGVTVFVTTHDLTLAERFCDQVGVIRHGRLVAMASPDGLKAQAGGRSVEFLGPGIGESALALLQTRAAVARAELADHRLRVELSPEDDVSSLIRVLVAAGFDLAEVRRCQPSLEDAYLALVESKP